MEENKLTIQEAAPYLGQLFLVDEIHQSYFDEPHENDYSVDCSVYLMPDTLIDIDTELISGRLILRQIENMTEEEKLDMRGLQDEVNYWEHDRIRQIEEISKLANYLRSIGVDCDNLIGQNKAIRKQ